MHNHESSITLVGAQARGPQLVGAHASRSGREKFDKIRLFFRFFMEFEFGSAADLVGGGARTNFSICRCL